MTASISGSEQRLSRLSLSVMRSVPRKPETLAEIRVVWREASISQTSRAGMPLARASERIGSRTSGSASGVYLLKIGLM